MKRFSFLAALVLCMLSAFGQGLTTGELVFQGDGMTPQKTGQATNDHLFTRYTDDGVTYHDYINLHAGETQLVWFWLDDDEIYQNEAVQALTPIPIKNNGELYNEITYCACQFDLYLPTGVSLVKTPDQQYYVYGDRLPYNSSGMWSKKGNTLTIDGFVYNKYTVVIYNVNPYGSHFSGRNANMYRERGALKKDDAPLLGLYLTSSVAGDLPDIIISKQYFYIRETVVAEWDANNSLFFFGTGGNNEQQCFNYYHRVRLSIPGILVDKHTNRIFPGQQFTLNVTTFPEGLEYEVTSSNPDVAQATIEDNTVLVKGITAGQATITVRATDGTLKADSCVVTVDPIMGDVDGNGSVNIADVTALIDYLLSLDATSYQMENADVDGDGFVSITDVVALIDYLLNGKIWSSPSIENVIPQQYLDSVSQYMPIYDGEKPPVIEGMFLMSPDILVYSSHGFAPGQRFLDYYYKFTNQGRISNTVDFEYTSSTGSDNTFTVFFKVKGTGVFYDYNVNYEEVQLYSGTIDENGIHDLYHGFVMLNKSDDPSSHIVPVGTVRVFKDGDGWSETTSWPFNSTIMGVNPTSDSTLPSVLAMPK